MKKAMTPAEVYHARPEVIHYFRESKLNHYSGDYRADGAEAKYRFLKAWRWLIRKPLTYLELQKLDNMHWARKD